MNRFVREIRTTAGLSQEEFAQRLGVSFATINRWENSRAVPNNLAQNTLYDFCREENIPAGDLILKKIENEVASLDIPAGRTVLFHGSKSGIRGEIRPVSREHCDFGAGFYMGTDPMQPLTLICGYEESRFYVVSVDMDGLERLDIPSDIEWAMIVAYNRGRMDEIRGTRFYEKYRTLMEGKDIITGSIADDRMFFVLDRFFRGDITDVSLVDSLSALELGRQYVAVSARGCDAVRIEKEIPLSHLERRLLQDISGANRQAGVDRAEEICRSHRREGRYFDEILDSPRKE